MLVADRGVTDAVISLGGDFDYVRMSDEAVEAGAGAGMPPLVGEARRCGRAGWAFLEAVPGSIGGGLRMNAGSTDTGLWDRAIWVDAMTPESELIRVTRQDAGAGYRSVQLPDDWVFVSGEFAAPVGEPSAVDSEHRERRRRKVESQVYELPSCGSTWKNPGPPHGSAWEVVDRVGMRGAVRGDAQVTEKHANFIANLGNATAADVLWLMTETRRRAWEQEGIRLEPEIRLWGFEAEEMASVGGTP